MMSAPAVPHTLSRASIALLLVVAASANPFRALAQHAPDSLLAAEARPHPDSARATIARALARSIAPSPDVAVATSLREARETARAYAIAWNDSFLVRQVAVFERWNREQRATKVAADRMRLAGNDAMARTGVNSALRLWRSSFRLAASLGDSAGQAAALGNIGAGFYRAGRLDSAARILSRARDVAISIGDHRTEGNALGLLANVHLDRGELTRAEQLYARASVVRALSGDSRGLAADQNNLGLNAQDLGDLEGARRAFEAALEVNRREGRLAAAAVNLTNLANIASMTSDFPHAIALYGEALAIHRENAHAAAAGSVLHNLGMLEMRRGDYERARVALVQALSLADSTESSLDAIAIRIDLAATYGAMGKLQAALAMLQRAERMGVEARAGTKLLAALALARAELAMQLNELSSAEVLYARAATLSRAAGDATGLSAAQQGQGVLLHLRQDDAGAARIFARGIRSFTALGDARSAASARLLLGHALTQGTDTAGGRRTLAAAARELAALKDVVGEATAMSALGDLAARGGSALAAESYYQRGLARLGALQAPDVRWQLHAGLGQALRGRGALAEASRELRTAVAEIERMSASLRLEERRSSFLADKWDAFAQLSLIERARGRDADAFAMSERMRARQMLDMLARGRVTLAPGGADTATARAQDLRQRISDLTRGLQRSGTGVRTLRGPNVDAGSINPVRDALDAAQKAYTALSVELRESNPAYARLVSGETVGWREIASTLAADQVMLEYLTTDSAAIVFVITKDTIVAIDLDISRRALTTLIGFAREKISRPAGSLPGASWRAPMRRLAEILIAPIRTAGFLEGKRSLIIIPHGELHFLPFQALLVDSASDRFLVEQFSISYAPSASLWLRLGQRMRRTAPDAVLAFAPRTDALPASAREVAAIHERFGDRASVFIGAAASERAFRMAAPTKSILHIATYGVLNKHNPLFSFIELAPDGNDDGRLEVHEVFALSLTARLVVLSACQTALGSGAIADVPPGDDWVGLVQAFLHAGAANVLATLWPVDDRMTATLMREFYRQFGAGGSEGDALAEAQRAALRDPRTAHPFYWAGFVLSGGR